MNLNFREFQIRYDITAALNAEVFLLYDSGNTEVVTSDFLVNVSIYTVIFRFRSDYWATSRIRR